MCRDCLDCFIHCLKNTRGDPGEKRVFALVRKATSKPNARLMGGSLADEEMHWNRACQLDEGLIGANERQHLD